MGCSQSKAVAGTAVGTVSSKAEGLMDSGTSPAATKALKESAPASPPNSDAGPPSRSSSTPTDDDNSIHSSTSTHSRVRSLKGSTSAIGLDKMKDEKRDAKNMSERVVHIEVPFGKPIEEVYDGVHDGPVLGSGISGMVRLVTHRATGLKYAVKCLDLGLVDTEEGLKQLREEIYIMCQLDHPNIVRLEEVYESHNEIYLVQQLCLGGELFDRLDEQPDYLKLENFLFISRSPDSELKMIDFGLSKHFKFGEVQHEAVGTPYTVAPEVIRGRYDERCDVWAIGVITFLLLSGESPFGGCGGPEPLMQVRDNIIKCNYEFEPEDIWENVSSGAKQFIKKLLVTDPNLRPTAREAQKDEWLIAMTKKNRSETDTALNPNVVKALVNFKEYSVMRKLLCEVLSFTLIPDQIQSLRKEFEKMDIDGTGEISLQALKTVLIGNAAQGSIGVTEEEVEDIFNAMRVSKTKTTIHWHEFIAAGLSHCKIDERSLRLAFDRLDADHTGYITFENFMDLIGNGVQYNEDALRSMWGEASSKNKDAYITYEDFVLLMKGQPTSVQPVQPTLERIPSKRTTPTVDQLHPVCELGESTLRPTTVAGSFLSTFDDHADLSDGPVCIEDDDFHPGFSEAMRHQGGGCAVKDSLRPKTPESPAMTARQTRSSSFGGADSSEEPPPPLIPVNRLNPLGPMSIDGSYTSRSNDIVTDNKTPLAVNKELYRAHRTMRLAVLEASKRLEDEQQRRAREEIQAAGLTMRHGEVSADAIQQFVLQQKREEQKKVQEATKRAGRRHQRNRTSSDIRGMFGGPGSPGSDMSNLTVPKGTAPPSVNGIPNFTKPDSATAKRNTLSPDSFKEVMQKTDLPELPKLRDATKPGQFRKTTYDPFSFGVTAKQEQSEGEHLHRDTSFHRHLDKGFSLKGLALSS
ncbi:hypothetical protein THAOC_37605 [Thalassiosira oceanica]|uniref:Calmodulin n=1 Tax=Thalassiosira oceanica TaxID=159749 RepID=K0QYK7_THAOC|nr:hypothetical protein THAOC_37605 [Thalassiosira oceanica]|eukprot:EJK43905.1 hypothetical protein THAOC_37605 [Thalassiosira oceanica]